MIVVDAAELAVRLPERVLFADLSVTIADGERLGVVGINGTGKSTLLRCLAGTATPDEGVVRFGRGARVSMLDQDAPLPRGTVREAVGSGWEAEAVLDRLGATAIIDADVETLSGGQTKRVSIARALVQPADLLVLDEPTNHLDIDGIEWLEDRLAAYRGALVLVTHDRHLLDRVTNRILEPDRGRAYVHEGGYQRYLRARAERELQAADAKQSRRNLAKRELAWLRRGAPARTAKPKARIATATALVEGRAQRAARSGDLGEALSSLGSSRLGSKGIELRDVGYRFDAVDGAPWLFRHLNLALDPGDRWGIVGANGTGKSTLVEIIAGVRAPLEGVVETGTTVTVGYYDQRVSSLDPAARVRDVVAGPARAPSWEDAALLERFWFTGETQWTRVGELSGGERRRLQLLVTLAAKPNMLLLDEPTNDLDLDTLRTLEDFLEEWAGILVVVSHDRAFLERTVEQVLALDGHGNAREVAGGYGGWLAQRRDARVATTVTPDRPPPSAPPAPRQPKPRSRSTVTVQLRKAEQALQKATERRDHAAAEMAAVAPSGHEALARAGHALADAEAVVTDAEERWLELATEADELG